MADPFVEIEAQALQILQAWGAEVVAERKAALATLAPPSSRPGETPHKRSGRLQAGITHNVRIESPRVVGVLRSEAPYSASLQGGMNRPIFTPVPAKHGPALRDRLSRIKRG
jgi:hypothetical protein